MIQSEGIYKILSIVDGDGFIGCHIISNDVVEFRLYGIDAPEIKICKKLKQDEKELHIAGSLLLKLGHQSALYLRAIAPVNTYVQIRQEGQNRADKYGRQLCYAYLPNGECINELMISDGFAKPYNNTYCEELPKYQILNTLAKQNGKGLYSFVKLF